MKIIKSLLFTALFAVSAFGQVQRNAVSKAQAVFTSASGAAYAAGESVGTAQTLTNAADAGRIITLDTVFVKDSANQKKTGYILFFDGSAPSLTDNAAFSFGSSLPNLIGVLDVTAADYVTFDSKGVATLSFLGKRMKMSNTANHLYVAFVTADAPTYGNGGTLTIDFHFSN